ncbi:hypothetical protein HZC31_05285 [Candidatus Woesearchaeota archaeon]|nr:hypothetical protein [Candidatus Woesearchaeota archaeon]
MVKLWYPEQATEFRDRYVHSPLPLNQIISAPYVRDTAQQLAAFPLLQALTIAEYALTQPVSHDDKKKISDLEGKMLELMCSGDREEFQGIEKYACRVVDPTNSEYMFHALNSVATCYSREKRAGIINRLLEDIAIGGTFIFFLEKDDVPVVYNKLFVTNTPDRGLVLFYDAIENGNVQANAVKDWKTVGKMDQLAASLAYAAFFARTLNITALGLADRELDEAGSLLGCGNSYLLPKGHRKVGYPTHPDNKGEVVYQNRLYGRGGDKYRVLETAHFQTDVRLVSKFFEVYETLARHEFKPESKHYNARVQFIRLAYDAISLLHASDTETRERVREAKERIFASIP